MRTDAERANANGQISAASATAATRESATTAEGLAWSLFHLAKAEGALDQVDQDLRLIVETVSGHLKLKEMLYSAAAPVDRRLGIVQEVFEHKVSPVSLSFLQTVVSLGRASLLAEIQATLTQLIQTEERKVVAEVTTAVPLDATLKNSLAERLSAITGKEVKLRHHVDDSILGGIVIRVDGKLLDGSLRHQLEALRDKMKTGKVKGEK